MDFNDLIPQKKNNGLSFNDLIPQKEPTVTDKIGSFVNASPTGVPVPAASGPVGAVAQKTSEVLTDPRSMFGLRQLEDAKNTVKGSVQNVISDVVRSPNNMNPTARAALGTAASMAVDAAPFSPTEFGNYAFGPLKSEFVAQGLENKAGQFANRYMDTTPSVGGPRLDKGKLPLGEETLKNIPEFSGGGPTKAYAQAKQLFSETENKVHELLNKMGSAKPEPVDIVGKGVLGEPVIERTVSKPGPVAIDLQKAKNSIQDLIQEKINNGLTPQARQIQAWADRFFKSKPDFPDAKQTRIIRSGLDQEIGAAHNAERMAPIKEAMKYVADNFRGQLAEKSPEFAALMKRESTLFDIMDNFRSRAQKGYDTSGWRYQEPITTIPSVRTNYVIAKQAQGQANFLKSPRGMAEAGTVTGTPIPFSDEIQQRRRRK